MSTRAGDPQRARLRRLARLLALAQAEARRSEQALGASLARLGTAVDRRRRIETLIADTAPRQGPAGALPLAAGAQLRGLLGPVADAARSEQTCAAADSRRAEARLAAIRTRVERLETLAHAERAQHARAHERRQLEAVPAKRPPAGGGVA